MTPGIGLLPPGYGGLFPYTATQIYGTQGMTDIFDWGQIGLPDVLKKYKGRGYRIGVVDTGIDKRHVYDGDLFGAVVAGRNFTNSDPRDIWDDARDGHGTHCAGVIGAREGRGQAIGMVPECELVVARSMFLGTGRSDWLANGIKYCVDQGCKFISNSWGSMYFDEVIAAAVEYARRAGVFVFAAAGNTGRENDVGYPARFNKPWDRPDLDCVAVAAAEQDGKGGYRLAAYSSRGPEVDIAGPGSNVVSTWVNGGYASLDGTSMATPGVVGMSVIRVERHKSLGSAALTPIETQDDLKADLAKIAKDLGPPGLDNGLGWGLLLPNSLDPAEAAPPVIPGRKGRIGLHIPVQPTDLAGLYWIEDGADEAA